MPKTRSDFGVNFVEENLKRGDAWKSTFHITQRRNRTNVPRAGDVLQEENT